jgi:hypothetical protein
LKAAGLSHSGVVRWGKAVPADAPALYLVALTDDPSSLTEASSTAPISIEAVTELSRRAAKLSLDKRPNPEVRDVADRLARMWLPDEIVVYIGKASTSVRQRVSQYYTTALGDRSPHAGGWALKTLRILPDLWIHWAKSLRPELAEQQALAAFADGVSEATRRALVDSTHLFPFANLEGPGGRKQHGIGGARSATR